MYDTFGVLFAGCHSLFNLIPGISQLAAKCLEEEASGSISAILPQLFPGITQRLGERPLHQPTHPSCQALYLSCQALLGHPRLPIAPRMSSALSVMSGAFMSGALPVPEAELQAPALEVATPVPEAVSMDSIVCAILVWLSLSTLQLLEVATPVLEPAPLMPVTPLADDTHMAEEDTHKAEEDTHKAEKDSTQELKDSTQELKDSTQELKDSTQELEDSTKEDSEWEEW